MEEIKKEFEEKIAQLRKEFEGKIEKVFNKKEKEIDFFYTEDEINNKDFKINLIRQNSHVLELGEGYLTAIYFYCNYNILLKDGTKLKFVSPQNYCMVRINIEDIKEIMISNKKELNDITITKDDKPIIDICGKNFAFDASNLSHDINLLSSELCTLNKLLKMDLL